MNKSIDVYWAPSQFTSADEQWNMLYKQPQSVVNNFVTETIAGSKIIQCPATKSVLKNVYSLESNITDDINLSVIDYKEISKMDITDPVFLNVESKVGLRVARNSAYKNYINVNYNLGWLMFSSEPLLARLTAPFFPVNSPVENSIFTVGQFDIGQWYRPMNLDYHIPFGAKRFLIEEGSPLAFVEFFTDKTVNLIRYELTPELAKISDEFARSPIYYGKRKTLAERYGMAKASGMRDLVLSKITKNII